jgi:phosphoribosyl 1,2-cyclic phosphodiesterase
MKITFYGVRGSTPVSGFQTMKYGGNTSCVHIELESGHDLILDAGTGIRPLGKRLASKSTPVSILLSHGHWDHVQGYPFFAPIYQPERDINVYIHVESQHRMLCSLFEQMDGSNFPIRAEDLPSNGVCKFKGVESELYEREGVRVIRQPLNHPGVDVLIHDAQYTEDDMPHKHGWGHSLISQVRQLATDAEVGALVMFHHDPDRSDSELDEIQIENQKYLKSHRAPTRSICAAEGMQLQLTRSIIGGDTRIKITDLE